MTKTKSKKSSADEKSKGKYFDTLSSKDLMEQLDKLKGPAGFFDRPEDLTPEMKNAQLNYEVIDLTIVSGGKSCIRRSPYTGKKVDETLVSTGGAPFKFFDDYRPVTDKEFRAKFVDLLKFPARLSKINLTAAQLYIICQYLGISGDSKTKLELIEEELEKQIEDAYVNLNSESFDSKDDGIIKLIKKKKRFDKYKSAIVAAQKAKSKVINVPLTDTIGKDGGYIQNVLPTSFFASKLADAGLDSYSPVMDFINKEMNTRGITLLKSIIAAGELKGEGLVGESQEIALLFSRGIEPRHIGSKSIKIVSVYDAPSTRGAIGSIRNVTSDVIEGKESVLVAEMAADKMEIASS